MHTTAEQPSSFRFSIRTLLVLLTVCAVLVASCVAINRSLNRQFGVGPYRSFDEWPPALKSLVGDDKHLANDVVPIGLSDFIDHSSIWKISSESTLRKKIDKLHILKQANSSHPNSSLLIKSIPASWNINFDFNNCKWYTTPGYGTSHIEGLDLFLIVDDPKSGASIVLHEWLF